MKIEMTETWCQGYGQCAAVDADLFPLDDEGFSAVGEGLAVPAGKEDSARLGVSSCPVQALRVTA